MSLNDFAPSEIAVLLSTCDKYNPGTQLFKLQSLTGLNENSTVLESVSVNKNMLMNKDKSNIPLSTTNKSTIIKLDLPKPISVKYPTKYIPPGTRFIVSFSNGDITKPSIVGSDF